MRDKNDLSQAEFGDRLGYSQKFVSDIETEKADPPREFLMKIYEVFHISIDYILYGGPPNKDFDSSRLTPVVKDPSCEYEIQEERRLIENLPKRKLIDKVLRILDSGNVTVVKALTSNLEAFLMALRGQDEEGEKEK